MGKSCYILLASLALFVSVPFSGLMAQESVNDAQAGAAVADSSVVHQYKVLDSTLIGRSIVDIVEANGGVTINQSSSVEHALAAHTGVTGKRKLSGYRIRIFFSNKQSARVESERVENEFREAFPSIPVYRTYPSPHFKVAVGDYRTRTDALKELDAIKVYFPDAYILKEREIHYPRLK